MTDAERLIGDELAARAEVPCYVTVPSTRPDKFLTIELTGLSATGAHGVFESYQLSVLAWAGSREEAAALLYGKVIPTLEELPELMGNVFSVEVDTAYRNPDPDTEIERYQANFTVSLFS